MMHPFPQIPFLATISDAQIDMLFVATDREGQQQVGVVENQIGTSIKPRRLDHRPSRFARSAVAIDYRHTRSISLGLGSDSNGRIGSSEMSLLICLYYDQASTAAMPHST